MSAAAPLRIGEMRRRLTLETPVIAEDGTIQWTTVATVWAGMALQGLSERTDAGRREGVARWRITLRWRGDVSSVNRLGLGDRLFRIIAAADPDGDRRWLEIEAEEAMR